MYNSTLSGDSTPQNCHEAECGESQFYSLPFGQAVASMY